MKLTYILAILLILQATRIIHACSCGSARTIQKAHASKDVQNIVRARLAVRDIDKGADRAANADKIYYGFLVEATYKGCVPSRFGQKGVVFMRAAGNGGLCRMPNLCVGKTYVLEVRKGFLPPLYLCGFFKGLEALSTAKKEITRVAFPMLQRAVRTVQNSHRILSLKAHCILPDLLRNISAAFLQRLDDCL